MTTVSMAAPAMSDRAQMDPETAIRAVYIRSLLLLALLAAVAMIDMFAPLVQDVTPSAALSADGAAGHSLR